MLLLMAILFGRFLVIRVINGFKHKLTYQHTLVQLILLLSLLELEELHSLVIWQSMSL